MSSSSAIKTAACAGGGTAATPAGALAASRTGGIAGTADGAEPPSAAGGAAAAENPVGFAPLPAADGERLASMWSISIGAIVSDPERDRRPLLLSLPWALETPVVPAAASLPVDTIDERSSTVSSDIKVLFSRSSCCGSCCGCFCVSASSSAVLVDTSRTTMGAGFSGIGVIPPGAVFRPRQDMLTNLMSGYKGLSLRRLRNTSLSSRASRSTHILMSERRSNQCQLETFRFCLMELLFIPALFPSIILLPLLLSVVDSSLLVSMPLHTSFVSLLSWYSPPVAAS
mmetsp:Transcript_8734/g.14510  ORF Transcript_8734/g.14510 Transcript_8734/m.14510 type:complete len:285 (-) Transcript_8734:657-1511(-)